MKKGQDLDTLLSKPFSKLTSDAVTVHGCIPTIKSLDIACKSMYYENIAFVLDHRVQPTQEMLEYCLVSHEKFEDSIYYKDAIIEEEAKNKYNATITLLGFTYQYDINDYFEEAKEIWDNIYTYGRQIDAKERAKIIDLLIKNGCQLTVDHVITALKNGYFINDVYKYDFTFPDNFKELCEIREFYPYNFDKLKITFSSKGLLYECKQPNNSDMIERIHKSGIPITKECLLAACTVVNNVKTLKYLFKHLAPDYDCLDTWLETKFVKKNRHVQSKKEAKLLKINSPTFQYILSMIPD